MDWLTFVTKLAEHIAWPTTTLVLVLTFKDIIRDKLNDLKTAKAGGIEAQFVRGLARTQDDLEKQEPFLAPRTAILKAYDEVEEAAKSVNLAAERTLRDAIEQLKILRDLVKHAEAGHQPTTDSALKYVALARQARVSLESLTQRERQILELIIAGRLNRQIAEDLNISTKTVEAHRANIMGKANVNTVAELVNWYHETEKS